MSPRARHAVATAAIVAHTSIAAFIGSTFTGWTLVAVIVPWIASGMALGLTLGRWINNSDTWGAP